MTEFATNIDGYAMVNSALYRIPASAFTHNGVFHADDVFGAALLRLVNPNITIERGRTVPEGYAGIVFDMGGGEFDHHLVGSKVRDNGVPYAAFGLLWEQFGKLLLAEKDAASFDRDFVQPIDLADNGGEFCLLSQLVSDFNPLPPADESAYEAAFEKAVGWAIQVLNRRFHRLRSARAAHDYVEERMAACDGTVLVLDRYVGWREAVVGSGYVYVVYPSLRGGYNIQPVPKDLDGRSSVLPFPEAWRGQPQEVLHTVTGICDFSFCHAGGFLCATDSLESALMIAHLALEGRETGADE